MKATKFWTGFIAIILIIAIAGGIAIFTIPELQTKIADSIVEKSQIYKNTCTELTLEKAKANSLSLQLSAEISAKNQLQQRYDAMEAERDDLLAQINEEYVIYFVEYSTNSENMFRFYLKNWTNESPVLTLGMYDVNDILTETFEFTLVNFANPENTPNTVVEDDLTSLADTYHIKFLDGNVVLSDFVCEDGSALNKAVDVHYEVFRKDTMFDVMQSRIANSDTSIVDLQNQLLVANARIAELERDKTNLQIQIEDLINNGSGLSDSERQEYERMIQQLNDQLSLLEQNQNVQLTLTRSNYYLQLLDSNDTFITYISKRIEYDNETLRNTTISGNYVAQLSNLKLGNIHTDDTYHISTSEVSGSVSGHKYYNQSTDDSIPTIINFNVYDEYGNVFTGENVNTSATYYITVLQLEHICYEPYELVGTSYEGQSNIMKTLNVSIIISANGYMN